MEILMIVGAGRSGTNLLARLLAADSRFVNLYESRYIWNKGQKYRNLDYRAVEEIVPETMTYIRANFQKFASNKEVILIDKTPGNALRIPFVKTVFPEAKFINVIRDGRACLTSRVNMWDKKRDRSGILDRIGVNFKLIEEMYGRGNLPVDRLPHFLLDTVGMLSSRVAGKSVIAGERTIGLRYFAKTFGMPYARAVQWRDVVNESVFGGRRLASSEYLEIKYEDLIKFPSASVQKIFGFLQLDDPSISTQYIENTAKPQKLEYWKAHFNQDLAVLVEPVLRPTMEFLGYTYNE